MNEGSIGLPFIKELSHICFISNILIYKPRSIRKHAHHKTAPLITNIIGEADISKTGEQTTKCTRTKPHAEFHKVHTYVNAISPLFFMKRHESAWNKEPPLLCDDNESAPCATVNYRIGGLVVGGVTRCLLILVS